MHVNMTYTCSIILNYNWLVVLTSLLKYNEMDQNNKTWRKWHVTLHVYIQLNNNGFTQYVNFSFSKEVNFRFRGERNCISFEQFDWLILIHCFWRKKNEKAETFQADGRMDEM